MIARPRSSWDRLLRDRPTTDAEIMDLRRDAYRASNFVTFTEEELERMPTFARAAIESEAKRILGREQR